MIDLDRPRLFPDTTPVREEQPAPNLEPIDLRYSTLKKRLEAANRPTGFDTPAGAQVNVAHPPKIRRHRTGVEWWTKTTPGLVLLWLAVFLVIALATGVLVLML